MIWETIKNHFALGEWKNAYWELAESCTTPTPPPRKASRVKWVYNTLCFPLLQPLTGSYLLTVIKPAAGAMRWAVQRPRGQGNKGSLQPTASEEHPAAYSHMVGLWKQVWTQERLDGPPPGSTQRLQRGRALSTGRSHGIPGCLPYRSCGHSECFLK